MRIRNGEEWFNSVCKPLHQAEPSRGLWRRRGADLLQPRGVVIDGRRLLRVRARPRRLDVVRDLGLR
jgi:hypothetical protein